MESLIGYERRCFDSRDIKHSAAALARHFVVQEHHVAGRFCELGTVSLVRLPWQFVDLLAQQPAQFVTIARPAKRAV
jgi:hypothetical protein